MEPKTHLTPPAPHHSPLQIPHISDGVIYRVLEDLLILDGERLSYRTLDVEQIGSVYEAIMGFELQVSAGKSIGIKPVKSHGAPATINLEALLAAKPADRAKLLGEWTDQKLGAGDAAALKSATSIDELVAALEKKIAKHVTPGIVPADSMVFQPSDERRRSGSHYTPRSLTQPIVRTTLEPILKQLITHPDDLNHRDTEAKSSTTDAPPLYLLASVVSPRPVPKELQKRLTKGEIAERERIEQRRAAHHTAAIEKGVPHPNQILDLKVCDPAMGSGAFLVETCRQLGDELIKSWYAHDMIPTDIPPDEDEVLYARRTVAQRCLYGVDKNIMAVDLAKLSLWLVTLAKDHPFTFLDHALRHGDSLVGLTREQIIGFHWEPKKQKKFGEDLIQKRLDRATEARAKILSAREDVAYRDQEQRMAIANEALNLIRLVGDACVSCFFAADKNKIREEELERVFGLASSYVSSLTPNNQQLTTTVEFQTRAALQTAADRLKAVPQTVPCFHWEIEFSEVFSRDNAGFDAFVGNPPFLKGSSISGTLGPNYLDWIAEAFSDSGGQADFVAYFLRQSFQLSRKGGGFGLLATQTICQGSTKKCSLEWIVRNGGHIYNAVRRIKWQGAAAVTTSRIHVSKSPSSLLKCQIDGRPVNRVSAFLVDSKSDFPPQAIASNNGLAFMGFYPYGSGFTFDDNEEGASPLSEMNRIRVEHPNESDAIHPYLGGEEFLDNPTQLHRRFVIFFNGLSEDEARAKYPELLEILKAKVKPYRAMNRRPRLRDEWWLYGEQRPGLQAAVSNLKRVLMHPYVSTHLAFGFVPSSTQIASPHYAFALDSYAAFASLQSRPHEVWVKFFASSLEERLTYTGSICFDTFPFPPNWQANSQLEKCGETYCELRSSIMCLLNEGLTKTYNRFHSPDERDPGILQLRRLHGEMDIAVLRAYGWDDLAYQAAQPDFCQFLLDYEEEGVEGDEWSVESDKPATHHTPPATRSRRRKPYRLRWPDDFRDEVLARLLELNEQRHREEQLAGKLSSSLETSTKSKTSKKAKSTSRTSSHNPDQKEMF